MEWKGIGRVGLEENRPGEDGIGRLESEVRYSKLNMCKGEKR